MNTLSYWEQEHREVDYAVVGGGLIGLCAALDLRDLHPRAKITVFERAAVPSGATTRNAGFVTYGAPHEILSDAKLYGLDTAIKNTVLRKRGIKRLRSRIAQLAPRTVTKKQTPNGNKAVGLYMTAGVDLLRKDQEWVVDELPILNRALEATGEFGEDLFNSHRSDVPGFNKMVYLPDDGMLHSGMLHAGLLRLCAKARIDVRFGAKVLDAETDGLTYERMPGREVDVAVKHGTIIAINSMTEGVSPARGTVLVTEVIPEIQLHYPTVAHAEAGFVYFRHVITPKGKRFLIGGGRHLDPAAEQTHSWEVNPAVRAYLVDYLRAHVYDKPLKIDYEWSGTMGFTRDKCPIIEKRTPKVVTAFGCNGMGVAMGPQVAYDAVQLLEQSR